MKRLIRRRPSPALLISLLALFMSMGGVSYGLATGSIDSREIRNNTIRTQDIRNNQVRGRDVRNSTLGGADIARDRLTGADILESSLGTVPRSTAAGSADTAASADAVGGATFQKFSYSAQAGTAFARVLDFGGLVLEAECQAGGGGSIRVRANPSAGQAGSELGHSGFSNGDSNFNPGDNTDVLLPADAPATGSIVFVAPTGGTVTVQAHAVEDPNDVLGTTNDCGFFGIAARG